MNIENLRKAINADVGKDLREFLLLEAEIMNRLPKTINPFNFFGSMIEVIASRKALDKIENMLNKLNITKDVAKKDSRDMYN